jgi:hypothetical protein
VDSACEAGGAAMAGQSRQYRPCGVRVRWTILRQYFHRFDTVILILIVIAAAWFVRSRWRNRLRVT